VQEEKYGSAGRNSLKMLSLMNGPIFKKLKGIYTENVNVK